MCHANDKKWEKRNDIKNWTSKSGTHQNSWREGKLQVLENIKSRYNQTKLKGKVRKEKIWRNKKKLIESKLFSRNPIEEIRGAFNKFPYFFVLAFKIGVDS